MAVSQGQFTIFEHNDGHTPVLGEDYFPAPYVANIIWQYYLSDSVKVLSPTTETTITFDDGTTATVGTWIDIVSESAIPIVKGLINGVETTYYRFRRQKYIMSDHTEENPHIKYSSEHLDETDQRILEWCSATDNIYMDGSRIAAKTITADKIDVNSLKVNKDFQVVITQPVKDLEIGGRNLIKISQLTAINCTIDATSTNNIEVTSVSSGNMAIIKIIGNYTPGDYILNASGSKSGKDFRILFDKNYDGACTYNSYYEGRGYPYFKDYATMPLKLTFTEATSIGFVMKSDIGAQTITGLKLEASNTTATDWTPAPEDMATAVELKVTNDKISTKVESSTYNSKMEQIDSAISTKVEGSTYNSKMEQLDSAISTKVESSTYESGLAQLADQMVAKVHNQQTGDNCSWNITPSEFKVKAVANNVSGGITVNSDGLTVDGIIKAQAGGTVGGWDVEENLLAADVKKVGLYSGTDYLVDSLVTPGTQSPTRFFCGTLDEINKTISAVFCVLADGSLYATAAKFSGENVIIDDTVKIGEGGDTLGNTLQQIVNKIPTSTSDLRNDSGFITESKVQEMIDAALGGGDNPGGGDNGDSGDDGNTYTNYSDGGDTLGEYNIAVMAVIENGIAYSALHITSDKIIQQIKVVLDPDTADYYINNYGGTLYYRVKNGDGSVIIDWRQSTTSVVTIELGGEYSVNEVYVEIICEYNGGQMSYMPLCQDTDGDGEPDSSAVTVTCS